MIVTYHPNYKQAFYDLNHEWIDTHFTMEPEDEQSLRDPEGQFITRGGEIFFVLDGDAPVGVVGVRPTKEQGVWEMLKMAVDSRHRGKGYSRALIDAVIAHVKAKKAHMLTLQSNRVLLPAMKLYQSYGFQEVPIVNSPFARADIQMELALVSANSDKR